MISKEIPLVKIDLRGINRWMEALLTTERQAALLLARSRQFFLAARSLFENPKSIDRQLRIPALFLTAQGIEVFLKAILVLNNHKLDKLKLHPFGHNIWHMWGRDEIAHVREEILSYAKTAEERAFASGRLSGSRSHNPSEDVLCHLHRLSILHTSKSDYALRYLPDENGMAPPPHLVMYCFDQLAERILGAPNMTFPLLGVPATQTLIQAMIED